MPVAFLYVAVKTITGFPQWQSQSPRSRPMSPSTVAFALAVPIPCRNVPSSISSRSVSPGFTCRRNLKLFIFVNTASLPLFSSMDSAKTAPTCASASTISTPGMMGFPGKCPWKNGSFTVTFLMPTAFPSPISSTLSTSKNGYRCGMISCICLLSSISFPPDFHFIWLSLMPCPPFPAARDGAPPYRTYRTTCHAARANCRATHPCPLLRTKAGPPPNRR